MKGSTEMNYEVKTTHTCAYYSWELGLQIGAMEGDYIASKID